jgi:hypothetical protein
MVTQGMGTDDPKNSTRVLGPPRQYDLERDYSIAVDLDLPPMSVAWLLIE